MLQEGEVNDYANLSFEGMNSADLELLYNKSQKSSAPIAMPLDQFLNLSDDDRSTVMQDAYFNSVSSERSPFTDQDFSNDLLSNVNTDNLLDKDDIGDSAVEVVDYISNTASQDIDGIFTEEDITDTWSGGPHTVESGNTLSEIAMQYKPENVDSADYIKQIKMLNGMRNDRIVPGQQLILPGSFEALDKELQSKNSMLQDSGERFSHARNIYEQETGDNYGGYDHMIRQAFNAVNALDNGNYFGGQGDLEDKKLHNNKNIIKLVVGINDPMESNNSLAVLQDIRTRTANRANRYGAGDPHRNYLVESMVHLDRLIKYAEGKQKTHAVYRDEFYKRNNS